MTPTEQGVIAGIAAGVLTALCILGLVARFNDLDDRLASAEAQLNALARVTLGDVAQPPH
jgi:hypothetical protein